MNSMLVWTDVLLESYNNLVNFADAVDRKIDILSHCNDSRLNALEVSNKIIDLMEKKISICNTKVLIENVINNLDKEARKLIVLKYIDKYSLEKIAISMKMTLRTIYRKMSKVREKFSKMLLLMGYTDEKLHLMYKDNLWLYNSFCSEMEKLREEQKLNIEATYLAENEIEEGVAKAI
ncbi:MAG: sigma-70 family RNA polymerase sigma factor [Clostridia bacterium]|nr:sigma-70 family RNA polymerase sigma factor [Clostridia bacterium]